MAQPNKLEARVLAGGADRDVARIRDEIRDFRQATTSSFNAMREDLTDIRTKIDNGFTEMRGKFDAAAAGQQHIAALLNTLISQQGGQPATSSPICETGPSGVRRDDVSGTVHL